MQVTGRDVCPLRAVRRERSGARGGVSEESGGVSEEGAVQEGKWAGSPRGGRHRAPREGPRLLHPGPPASAERVQNRSGEEKVVTNRRKFPPSQAAAVSQAAGALCPGAEGRLLSPSHALGTSRGQPARGAPPGGRSGGLLCRAHIRQSLKKKTRTADGRRCPYAPGLSGWPLGSVFCTEQPFAGRTSGQVRVHHPGEAWATSGRQRPGRPVCGHCGSRDRRGPCAGPAASHQPFATGPEIPEVL